MSELYRTMPAHVPKPQGWGRLSSPFPSATVTHFFLCEFVNISNALPDPAGLASIITELHKKSVSPTGKFSFHITTYDGKLPQVVDWDDSWASFFGKCWELRQGSAVIRLQTTAFGLDAVIRLSSLHI
jgi:protein-ribulosamine 3-kinase